MIIWGMLHAKINKVEETQKERILSLENQHTALRTTVENNEDKIDRKLDTIANQISSHTQKSYEQHLAIMQALHTGLDGKMDKK